MGLAPPTRSISPSWMARSSLACRSKRRSPISSRNSVPPAALVSEQRALDQLVRDRGEVDRDERRIAPPGLAMEQPGEQLLAGAALPEDEHRRREPRHLLHQIDDVANLLAGADQELSLALLRNLRAQGDHLPVEVLALAGIADERSQLVVVEVLGDVVVGAVLHRLDRGLDLVDRRDHDALDEVVVLLDDAEDVEAADPGQPDVEEDQVDVFVLEQAERGLAARHRDHLVVTLQDRGDGVAHALIVITDEDRLGWTHREDGGDCSTLIQLFPKPAPVTGPIRRRVPAGAGPAARRVRAGAAEPVLRYESCGRVDRRRRGAAVGVHRAGGRQAAVPEARCAEPVVLGAALRSQLARLDPEQADPTPPPPAQPESVSFVPLSSMRKKDQ
jgi:hypothetical protein